MAVALQSNSAYDIVSQDASGANKSVFLVKLTDSCLKSLEQHKNQTMKHTKSSSFRKPSIHFKGKSGVLFIPSQSSSEKEGTTFNFSGSSLFNETSTVGLDCFQQKKGDMGLILLGNIAEKITVSANNDSYQATRTRMAEAESKRKGNSAKVIELLQADGAKKPKRNPQQRQRMAIRKLKNTKFHHSSTSSSKGLREKVIHLLALRPLKKLELRLKLEKDGVKLNDATVLTNILQQVAVMQDNQYNLNRHLYADVQVDTWPAYTDEEREAIRNKLMSEMGTSVDRLSPGPLASALHTNNSSKRPLPSGANPAGKKQRIAHNPNIAKIEIKQTSDKSPPKLTSRPPVKTVRQSKSSTEHRISNHKMAKPTTDKGASEEFRENSKNTENSNYDTNNNNSSKSNDSNNNFSFTEKELAANKDYLINYPKITSYEQRCSYKQDFTQGYIEYTALKERSDLVSQEFNDLKERLKKLPEDSEKAKEIHAEIFKLYEEKKEKWTKDRQKIYLLYPKLSHIKRLVIEYDQSHAS